MAPKPQCPFCLRQFENVEQLTQHLIFDNCKLKAQKPLKKEKKEKTEGKAS